MNTFVLIATVFVAFIVTAALGFLVIPYLRRLKFGQTILDIGPAWHKNKQGTPTMGGFLFIGGVVAAVVAAGLTNSIYGLNNPDGLKMFFGVLVALAYGAIGFLDDYIKVVKKRNMGLTARQKYLMQLVICVLYLWMLYLAGDRSTIMEIPFFGQVNLGLLYYPFMVFVITGFVNAVNLTDGIDGLASSVTFVYAIIFLVICGVLRHSQGSVMAAALAGGCLGFLIWNFHPAKVFMGDTGSMFLGGMVVALAFEIGLPLLLVLAGVVYWCEALSVILQVISYKTTRKRIFKMSPIHHHFEMCGWSEIKIVWIFSFAAFLGGILAILSVIML